MEVSKNKVVSRENWLKAREEFLKKEKAFTKQRDELNRERMGLPWLEITKEYVFEGEEGPKNLKELFGNNSQLLVYHFMFAPEWTQGCMGCSFMADNFNGSITHLGNHDVTMAVVSRAPLEKILKFRQRMGWEFPWVSSQNNDFNRDFKVSFTEKEAMSGEKVYNFGNQAFKISEAPGLSAFYKDENDKIYLTYSTFARGLDMFIATYHLLDVAPKGRNEEKDMNWVRHHDRYKDEIFIPPWEEKPGNSVREST